MPLFTSGVWLLGALLSFTSMVLSVDVDPVEDFCSLSAHMSRAPSTYRNTFIRFFLTKFEACSGSERWYSLYRGRMDALFFGIHEL